ncbi:type II CAAX endopeptidase family protein [Neobacillus sp.]|uniref:CPBP family intramembrane glutamic endopeptidase n=1 Tax=Neobacillus sp. TaxID=2675273 RepID=UPI00289C2114|nr:type II CAAX endopeptidase family protein [Neobacillus sp.]
MGKLVSKIIVSINNLKETSWLTILLFSILYCVYVTIINLVVFKSNIIQPISVLTLGLVNQTLIVNIVSLILFVFILIIKYGRLTFFDIGLKGNRLLSAVTAVSIIWIAMQLINIVIGIITTGKPIIYEGWNQYGALKMFGSFIGQLFGNSLFEEVVFRGFLLVQISKKLKNKKGQLFIGIFVSQFLFALIHIPNRILGGMNVFEIVTSLIILFMIGIFFAIVYLLTDNLFLVIGIHTIWNTPLLVFNGLPSILVIFVATIILLLIWDRTFGRLSLKATNQ